MRKKRIELKTIFIVVLYLTAFLVLIAGAYLGIKDLCMAGFAVLGAVSLFGVILKPASTFFAAFVMLACVGFHLYISKDLTVFSAAKWAIWAAVAGAASSQA